MKTCYTCKKTKPFDEFHHETGARDGHTNACKICRNTYAEQKREFYATQAPSDSVPTSKRCFGCKHVKDLQEFPAKRGTKDGHAIYCKPCESARVVAYRKAHPAIVTGWNATPQGQLSCITRNARRRALLQGVSVNDFTRAQWGMMKEQYGYRCVYCQRKMQRLTMDHVIPLSKGGNHMVSNIVPACQSCNSRKGTGDVLVPIQPLLLCSA